MITQLIIVNAQGKEIHVPFLRPEIIIGRKEGSTIRLQDRNISRRHARLTKTDDGTFIEDLDSYNGVTLNGNRITRREALYVNDQLIIGDFIIRINEIPEKSLEPMSRDEVENYKHGREITTGTTIPQATILSPPRQPTDPPTVQDTAPAGQRSYHEPDDARPAGRPSVMGRESLVSIKTDTTAPDQTGTRQHRVPTQPVADFSEPVADPQPLPRPAVPVAPAAPVPAASAPVASPVTPLTPADPAEPLPLRPEPTGDDSALRPVREETPPPSSQEPLPLLPPEREAPNSPASAPAEASAQSPSKSKSRTMAPMANAVTAKAAAHSTRKSPTVAKPATPAVSLPPAKPAVQPVEDSNGAEEDERAVPSTSTPQPRLASPSTRPPEAEFEQMVAVTASKIQRRRWMPVLLLLLAAAGSVAGFYWYQHHHTTQVAREARTMASQITQHQQTQQQEPVKQEPSLVPPPKENGIPAVFIEKKEGAAPKITPDEIATYLEQTRQLIQRNKWAGAQESATQILRDLPGHPEANELMLKAKSEASSEHILMKATKLYQQKNYDPAIIVLTDIPDSSVYYDKAQALNTTIVNMQARQRYLDASQACQEKRYQVCLKLANDLLEADPANDRAMALKQKAQAKLKTVSPEATATPQEEEIQQAKEPEAAQPRKPVEKASPGQELFQEGNRLFAAGKYRDAAAVYKQIIAMEPRNAGAYRALGSCYASLRQTEQAVRAYEQYVKIMPNAPDAAQVRQIIEQYHQQNP